MAATQKRTPCLRLLLSVTQAEDEHRVVEVLQKNGIPLCFEDDMVSILQQFFHFVRTVGRAEDMNFFAGHFLRAQPRFKQAAGFGARQVRRQQRV